MKSLLTFFLTLFVSLAFHPVFSKPVTKTSASVVARNFMARWGNPGNLKSGSKTNFVCQEFGKLQYATGTPSESPAFYIFNLDGSGYIIVSGDDRVPPVLAFSRDGHIDLDNIHDNIESFFRDYEKEINYINKINLPPSANVEGEWKKYLNDDFELKSAFVVDSVKPLTTTRWGYGTPYNNLCPYDASIPNSSIRRNKHCPAGCAAVAMAQIMQYWAQVQLRKYWTQTQKWYTPLKGFGSNSYESFNYGILSANFGATDYKWDIIPDDFDNNSTDAQKNAIATLMFHCGISLNMDYGPDVSGIYRYDPYTGRNTLEKALATYFGYKNSMKAVVKSSYTDITWVEMMKNEIASGRPVIYDGVDEAKNSGHAFIIDGFKTINNTSYFSVNWGLYNDYGKGYFLINSMGFPPDYNFTSDACVLIGIEPGSIVKSENIALSEPIRVWPNPATDRLQVDLNGAMLDCKEIDILNGLGVKIMSVPYSGKQLEIPLDRMASGMYFIRFNSREKYFTRKFMVKK